MEEPLKNIGLENFQKEILFEAKTAEEMFEKENELVEIGSYSYNLKSGGYGGWDYANKSSSKEHKILAGKKGFIVGMTNRNDESFKKMREGGKKSISILREKGIGIFNEDSRLKGVKSSKLEKSLQKRKDTYFKINHQQGEKNSQYGTMWITNGTTNRKIKKEDVIPEGWRKGRKIK